MPVRTVTLCNHVPRSRGGRAKLWAFGVADLAKLLRVSVPTIRRRLAAGTLDPADLVGPLRSLPRPPA